MLLTVHDPGHVGLHRGIRAALGTTAAMAIAIAVLPGTPATMLAAFGSVALLGTADFGGSTRRRLTSLLATGVAGCLLIVIGALAASTTVTLVAVTFVVTAALALLVQLRGSFANACPALTTVYVATAMVSTSANSVPPLLAGWGIAVAVAIPVTLLVLPRRDLAPVRQACSQALAYLSQAARERAHGGVHSAAHAQAALDQLRSAYLGNPFRAAGLRTPDRALLILVGQLEGLLMALLRPAAFTIPVGTLPGTRQLIEQSADSLEGLALALRPGDRTPPSGLALAAAWERQWDTAVRVLTDASAGSAEERVEAVHGAFPDRALALSVIRLTILVRRALGLPDEEYDESRHSIPAPPLTRPWHDLAQQLTLRSPWMRLALRTGAALALAALVVEVIGLDHGFWVLLGVVATLRFDGLTTLKTSLWAVLGTFAGAMVGYALLYAELDRPVLLWGALVIVTFLAVYTQATAAYALGQACFSLFVIVAFSLANWPPELRTAETRFVDVLIGALISVLVALLMWPRGVVKGLRSNVAAAIRRATSFLSDAMADLVDGPGHIGPGELTEMSGAFVRSKEVVEVTLTSRQPDATERAQEWEEVIDHLRTLTVAGHLLSDWSRDRPPVEDAVPELASPLRADTHAVVEAWDASAAVIDDPEAPATRIPPLPGRTPRAASEANLADPAVADRVVGAVWAHGWLTMSYNAAVAARQPVLANR
ncbi:MAG: FUSC family protein [bacterium]